jgi:MraZ protein
MSLFLNTALFLSTHVNRIDGKGRVSFPAPFRSALTARNSQGVVLFRSPADTAIEGITIERMQQMSAALETLSPFSRDRAFFETAIFGTAQELQVDREGRCSLPRPLLEQVGIVGDVAFLGRGPTFQIWEPQALARRTAESTDALNSGAVAFPILPSGIL